MSLRDPNDAHDCDGMVLRNLYESMRQELDEVTVMDMVRNSDVPEERVLQWAESQDDLTVVPGRVIARATQPSAPEPEESGDPILDLMLTRIHDSGRLLGAAQVELALLKDKLARVDVPFVGVIRKLFRYSWRDIEFNYDMLTEDEKKCGTREELEYLMDWASKLQ